MSEPRQTFFVVDPDYQVGDVIGTGAYGIVRAALHKPSKQPVAIKKINPFDHALSCRRTLRELKLLRYFHHENIISILAVQKPNAYEDLKDVYLIQELMQTNMHLVIQNQELSNNHCQYFVYQILRGLKALHSANVLHRDLKPSNLLVNANCDLKICDFGLARSSSGVRDEQGSMTEYVATRWYRAPEIMLDYKRYTKAIDMWSVGCILAEMLIGEPLFPGKDYFHQITLIFEVLGTPTREDVEAIRSERTRSYICALPVVSKPLLGYKMARASDSAPDRLDLLENLLAFNPARRLTVEQALEHPYLNLYHDLDDEPTVKPVPEDLLAFDKNANELSLEQLKSEFVNDRSSHVTRLTFPS